MYNKIIKKQEKVKEKKEREEEENEEALMAGFKDIWGFQRHTGAPPLSPGLL